MAEERAVRISDWADRAAARRNARTRAALPLLAFAGQLPEISAEEIRALEARRLERGARARRRMDRRARLYRWLVSRRISAEDLELLDSGRAICPPAPEYAADVYGGELRRLMRGKA